MAGPTSLLPVPREALSLRFGEQILHTTPGRKARFRRRLDQPVCSPLLEKPYSFVSGSKFFTQLPAGKRNFVGGPAGTVCSPLPAKPYPFVSGSKFFTQLSVGKCDFASGPAGRFAPRSPLGFIPSFQGANSSHNFRPECAVSPAAGPAGLLPAPR